MATEIIAGLTAEDFIDVRNVRKYPQQAAELIADMLGKQFIIVDVSGDESTDLTTGDGKRVFRIPYACTITGVKMSVSTAPTGAAIEVDIRRNGSTIFTTKPTIDATEKTTVSAATPAVLNTSQLAADDEIHIDVDQIGSSAAGKGLKVTLLINVT